MCDSFPFMELCRLCEHVNFVLHCEAGCEDESLIHRRRVFNYGAASTVLKSGWCFLFYVTSRHLLLHLHPAENRPLCTFSSTPTIVVIISNRSTPCPILPLRIQPTRCVAQARSLSPPSPFLQMQPSLNLLQPQQHRITHTSPDLYWI